MDQLLDAQDVKKILNCALATVYKMVDRGQLPCVRWTIDDDAKKPKSIIRFKKQDVIDFINSNYTSST